MRAVQYRLLAAALLVAAVAIGCGGARSAAQRIDDAAALIGKSVNAGADDVKSTFGSTIRASDDEAFAASLERIAAAKPSWTSQAWNAAKTTVEVVRSEPISIAADLVCEGLERWELQQQVTGADLQAWGAQLSGLPSDDPVVRSAAETAWYSLEYHSRGDWEYIRWIRGTACLVDAIP